MQDLFQKCREHDLAEAVRALGIYPYFKPLNSGQDNRVCLEGRETLMLGSNNYLGLTSDERVKAAAIAALERYGSGCSGSRFLNGTLDLHLALEADLAAFLHKEAVCTFSTGFQSNLAIISALCKRHDIILSDARNHASIVDACRLSFAKCFKFPHNDMAALEDLLERHSKTCSGGILIVTDGVFSMEGDICHLPEMVALKKRYGARLLVDDAHSLGVLGERGAGTGEHFGLEDEVDLIMNTFSKSLASLGGCVAGDRVTVEYIRHHARPFIFSASVPPAQTVAAHTALKILRDEPWRVAQIHANTRKMKELLKRSPAVSLSESGNDLVPILPLHTGTLMQTLYTAHLLSEAGVYVNPVLPPAVPEGECLLRTSYTATMDEAFLEEAAAKIIAVFEKIAAEGLPAELTAFEAQLAGEAEKLD